MRTLLILIATVASNIALAAEPRPVTLDLKDVPLPAALARVQDAGGLRLAYANDLIGGLPAVTLRAHGEPAERVLRRMLRPRGLEFVRTADALGAIVRADRPIAMAKAMGSTVRVFAAAARKLEAAELRGDEIRAPGWLEQDDRGLAEAIVDYYAGRAFFSMRRISLSDQAPAWFGEDAPLEELQKWAAAFDPDVRAGAGLALAAAWWTRAASPDRNEQLRTLRVTMAETDPDVTARACWLWGVVNHRLANADGTTADREPAIRKAMADPAMEIRAAVASKRVYDNLPQVSDDLRAEPSAAVRALAWDAWIRRCDRDVQPGALQEIIDEALADPSPIVRAIGLANACRVFRTVNRDDGGYVIQTPQIDEALEAAPIADDPWLKLVADACVPICKPTGRHLADALVKLASSAKPSHRVLACALALRAARGARDYPDPWPEQPQPPDAGALAESDSIHARVVGLMADAHSPAPAAEQRLIEAMKSGDEIIRLVALLSCCDRPTAPSAALEAAFSPLLRSPMPSEQMLAARALCRKQPVVRLIELLRNEPRTAPASLATRTIVEATKPLAARSSIDTYLAACNAALDIPDPDLQAAFFQGFNHYGTSGYEPNSPLIALVRAVVEKGHPLLLRSIFAGRRYGNWIQIDPETARVAFDRIRVAYAGDDPAQKRQAVLDIANVFGAGRDDYDASVRSDDTMLHSSDFFRKELKDDALVLIGAMLERCFAAGATTNDAAAGLSLLGTLARQGGPLWSTFSWREAPPWLRTSTLAALNMTEDKTLGPAARLLASLHLMAYKAGRQERGRHRLRDRLAIELQNDTEVIRAMDAARERVMRSDRSDDHALLLCALAEADDAAIARPAVEQIETRLRDGTLPAARRRDAIAALATQPALVSPDCVQHLLRLLGENDADLAVRREIVRSFHGNAKAIPALLYRLIELARKGDAHLEYCGEVQSLVWRALAWIEQDKLPEPEWLPRAAELGLIVARDARLPNDARSHGLGLYANAARPDPLAVLDEFLLDDDVPMPLRVSAASSIKSCRRPGVNGYEHLLQHYDRLPFDVRYSLVRNLYDNSPGRDELLLRALDDPELKQTVARYFYPPPTRSPKLEAAFAKHADDPVIGRVVKRWMKSWEEQEKQK